MRLMVILLSGSTLAFASGAIAQTPRTDQKPTQQAVEIEQAPSYEERAPYRPCPAEAAINGRNVCLGCPSRCPWPPSFGK